jgi:hypothetical protein
VAVGDEGVAVGGDKTSDALLNSLGPSPAMPGLPSVISRWPKFIKTSGHHGWGQGEFDVTHGLAMDSAGRLFVADRANNRIRIFDQDGKFLAEWK